jgi:hypothetical protein
VEASEVVVDVSVASEVLVGVSDDSVEVSVEASEVVVSDNANVPVEESLFSEVSVEALVELVELDSNVDSVVNVEDVEVLFEVSDAVVDLLIVNDVVLEVIYVAFAEVLVRVPLVDKFTVKLLANVSNTFSVDVPLSEAVMVRFP